MADSAELCVITFYLKSVSTHFSSTYSVKILVSLAILKEDVGNAFLQLSDTSSHGTNVGVTSVIQASQQEVTSDILQIKYVHIVPASFVLFQLGNCTYRWHVWRVRLLSFISNTEDLQEKKSVVLEYTRFVLSHAAMSKALPFYLCSTARDLISQTRNTRMYSSTNSNFIHIYAKILFRTTLRC
jgi:hypothetical protein